MEIVHHFWQILAANPPIADGNPGMPVTLVSVINGPSQINYN
jgi:hypothetical protein